MGGANTKRPKLIHGRGRGNRGVGAQWPVKLILPRTKISPVL